MRPAQPPKEIASALPPPSANIVGNVFRRWFNFRHIEVYIRINQRMIGGRFCRTLELSNVEIEEAMRGQGRFSRLLDGLAMLAAERGEVLIVENVISEVVRGAVLRRGFIDYQGSGANFAKLDIYPPTKGIDCDHPR